MYIRLLLIFSFIFFCVRIRTNPARYFQLNAQYFDENKGIFSKLDIDKLIPLRWRLRQCPDNGQPRDFVYPVFVKPEWGQNAYGISRADNAAELDEIRRLSADIKIPRIIQEAATEAREFEIFFILSATDETKASVLTVSEAVNLREQTLPINSINNSDTVYRDLTATLDTAELDAIWKHVCSFGRFGISRVGIRADSIADLVKGHFHVIEINLFAPMPINLLDPEKSLNERVSFILNTMLQLARIVKCIPRDYPNRDVFFKKWRVSRKLKMLAATR